MTNLKYLLKKYSFEIVLTIYSFLYLTKKINLYTADLGRHIKNGEFLFKDINVLYTNFYSYTYQSYEVLNHHWLYGVISYGIYSIGGFLFLSLFNSVIYTVAIVLLYKSIKTKFSSVTSFLTVFLLLPLFLTRTEVRPETVSLFFISLSFYLYLLYLEGKVKFKKLLVIILVSQVVWVNTHIFFILQFCLQGALFLHLLLNKDSRYKNILLLSLTTLAACFINPFFYRGVLSPLNIFKEYGYMLVENQSIYFMQKRFFRFEYILYELLLILSLISIYLFYKKRVFKKVFFLILLWAFFTVLAFKFNRALPLFAIFTAPLISLHISKVAVKTLYPAIITVIILLCIIPTPYSIFSKGGFGLGLMPSSFDSVIFLKQNKLSGPIFNNYDIGGYLIFNLFDKERVFVDNRPEAYPADFFTQTYIPMQKDKEFFNKKSKEYNFNLIYFYRHDLTPWAQEFLVSLIDDNNWAPIYVDGYSIIFIKNTSNNSYISDKYKLPREIFSVK